jgi:hypothetical protein
MNKNELQSLKALRIQMEALIAAIADHRASYDDALLLTGFVQHLVDATNGLWQDERDTSIKWK